MLGLGHHAEDKVTTLVFLSFLGISLWRTTTELYNRHGRDNKLQIWQLREEDEAGLSTTLPIEDSATERKQPWLLHSLDVNALNFCSFAICNIGPDSASPSGAGGFFKVLQGQAFLTAVPGIQDGNINVTSIPNEERVATIASPRDTKTGMVMAVGLVFYKGSLLILAGYESGHTCVWRQNKLSKWEAIYLNQAHTQPILSLDASLEIGMYYTSAADAIITAHHLVPSGGCATRPSQTRHAGQQSLTVRSDGKIFATAGWDGRARVYSTKTLAELAVLKWHKEGCYAIAFADVNDACGTESATMDEDADGTSIGLTKRELTVQQRRVAKAQTTHWLAAGSKDGKVSLWDIY